MNKVEYAIYFATKAHMGQKRKTENVDMIFHPMTVGYILKENNMKDECIIAGFLHDVIEDTRYTKQDIINEFGMNVYKIIEEVSEDKKIKDWKQRKILAIEKIKQASFDGKMVECVDKIHNLETLYNIYLKEGESVWDNFNSTKDDQKWYYTKMYEAVINGIDTNDLIKRYKMILNKLFGEK